MKKTTKVKDVKIIIAYNDKYYRVILRKEKNGYLILDFSDPKDGTNKPLILEDDDDYEDEE